VIEDTRKQLREARIRLKESREALAAGTQPLGGGETAPLDRLENRWGTLEPTEPIPGERYVPPSAPDWLQRFLARLPAWARPAVVGTAAVTAFMSGRMLYIFPHRRFDPMAVGFILFAAASGAVGGLTFSLVRPKLERLGAVGDILTGIACVATCLVVFLVVPPLVFGDRVVGVSTPGDVVMLGVCSVLLGSLVGSWFNAAWKPDADSQ
jgi:hypothetical protein